MKTLIPLAVLLVLAGCAMGVAPTGSVSQSLVTTSDPASPASFAPIDPRRLSDEVRVLASDEFQGRAPGTPGEERTVRWLVDQFRGLGLQPGGPGGSWTQTVPLIRTQVSGPVALSFTQGGKSTPLAYPNDVYVSTTRDTDAARIAAAPMVFVGYGVAAPERGWDDFKGVDLHGKVAVFLVNDPDFEAVPGEPAAGRFGGPAMTYYGRWTYKFEEAARRGAIGALIVHETDAAGYGWNVIESPGGENYNVVLGPGDQQPLLVAGWIQRPVAEAMLRGAGLDYATLKREARRPDFRPVDLGTSFSAQFAVRTDRIQSRNVLARIPGATRPAETVAYGAHWDAYGVGKPDAQGRRIRPGAADDGTGIAGLIEIARAFRSGPAPQRSILFAAWTAEERGLLGSEYYAAHPVWPLATTVADLTIDTLQTAGPTRDVVRVGSGQSELEDYLTRFAAAQGRTVTPESHPERGLFYRADHFPLAKKGVPVLLLMDLAGGSDLLHGGREAGERWLADYTGRCYHQTCDAWSADWDLRGAAQDVALLYAIGRDLANSRAWPQWREGSEFRSQRESSAAERAGR